MKRILPILLFFSCAASQQAAVCPPPTILHDSVRVPIPTITYEFLYDTVIKYKDTAYVTLPIKHDTVPRIIKADSALPFVVLRPDPSGDSYALLQGAIDNYIATGVGWPLLLPGEYQISRPLLACKIVDGQYKQVSLRLEGAVFAKNTPAQYTARITAMFTDGFALGIQQGKGCVISNISFAGQYYKAATLDVLQIDTLPFAAWGDGVCSINRSSPYGGIVIDPFGAKESYDTDHLMYRGLEDHYLPGAGRAGSTAIKITGCSFERFVAPILITPSVQQNGEEIDVEDCSVQNCITAYSFTQAQSKANTISRMQIWGGVRTILDGGDFGWRHSDGATCPMVDVMNIAGYNHELINCGSYTFPITLKRVYAEGLFKIGFAGGFAGTHFQDFQIDFQNGFVGLPTPDFYCSGDGIVWDNCLLRIYNGGALSRLFWHDRNDVFKGGSISGAPVVDGANRPPRFEHTWSYYGPKEFFDGTAGSDWDTTFLAASFCNVRCDRSTFNGLAIGVQGVKAGDDLFTQRNNDEAALQKFNTRYPIGKVVAVAGDTVYLQNMGMGIRDGAYPVWANRAK